MTEPTLIIGTKDVTTITQGDGTYSSGTLLTDLGVQVSFFDFSSVVVFRQVFFDNQNILVGDQTISSSIIESIEIIATAPGKMNLFSFDPTTAAIVTY